MATRNRKQLKREHFQKKRPSALGLEEHLPIEGQGWDEMMLVYSWSFEDALKAQKEWENKCGSNIQGRGRLYRWTGAPL